jgi:hypothetical protein
MNKDNNNGNSKNNLSNKVSINHKVYTKEFSQRKSVKNLNYLTTKTNMTIIKEGYNLEANVLNNNSNLNELKRTALTPNFNLSLIDNSFSNDFPINNNSNQIENYSNKFKYQNSTSIKTAQFNTSGIGLSKVLSGISKNFSKGDSMNFNYINQTNALNNMSSFGPNRTQNKSINNKDTDNNYNYSSAIGATNNISQIQIPFININKLQTEDHENNNLLFNASSKDNFSDMSFNNLTNQSSRKFPFLKKLTSLASENFDNKSNQYIDSGFNTGLQRTGKLNGLLGGFVPALKFKRSPSYRGADNRNNQSNISNYKNDHSQINLLTQDSIGKNFVPNKLMLKLNTSESNVFKKDLYKRVMTSKNIMSNSRKNLQTIDKLVYDTGYQNFDSVLSKINKRLEYMDEEDLPPILAVNTKKSAVKLDFGAVVKNLENMRSGTEKQISIPYGTNINLKEPSSKKSSIDKAKQNSKSIKNEIKQNSNNNYSCYDSNNNLKKDNNEKNEDYDNEKELELKDLKDMKMSDMNMLKDATLVKKKNELSKKDKPKEEDVEISVEQIIYKNYLPKIFLISFSFAFLILYSMNIFFNISYVNKINYINQYSKTIQERIGLLENLLLNYEVAILLNTTRNDYSSLFKAIDKNRLEIIEMNKGNNLNILPLTYDLEKNLGDKKFCEYISVKLSDFYKTSAEKELLECKLVGNQINSNGFYNAYSTVYNTLNVFFNDMFKLADLSEDSLIAKIMDFSYFNVKMIVDFTFKKLDGLSKDLVGIDLDNIYADFLNVENIFSIVSLILCIVFCLTSIIVVILPIKSVEAIISWMIHKLLKES